MRVERSWTLMAVMAVCLAAAAAADDGPPAAGGKTGSTVPAEDGAREVPCSPVATAWPVSGSEPYALQAPQLAVAFTDIRPKDGMVFLDGRFAGRARYFNGTKGFLYLEPGDYRLELRLDGYRTEAFQIAARPSCQFEIRHRMQRSRGSTAEGPVPPAGKGEPVQWIWAPIAGAAAAPTGPGRPAGPDTALRPDLGLGSSTAPEAGVPRGSLRLRVKPPIRRIMIFPITD
jgi:hypothetical protein